MCCPELVSIQDLSEFIHKSGLNRYTLALFMILNLHAGKTR